MKLVIFGVGSFADLAAHYFAADSEYEVVAYSVDGAYVSGDRHGDLPLVPFEDLQAAFPPGDHAVYVAIGYSRLNALRERKVGEAKAMGYSLASYRSSRAFLGSAEIGENAFIFENAVVQPFAKVGAGPIIWPGAIVSHHSEIGDYCYLSPNATVCGNCRVGNRVFLGAGSVVRDSVAIASDVVIGLGAVVTRDAGEPGTYTGSPAALADIPGGISPEFR